MIEPKEIAIVCATCGGDPRTSATCKTCGGAGMTVASPDGYLVWSQTVNEASRRLRHLRKNIRTGIHVFLLLVGLSSAAVFLWQVAVHIAQPDGTFSENVRFLWSRDLWFGGHWYVILFFIGLVVDAFTMFRHAEYANEEKEIPVWRMTAAELEAHDAAAGQRATHRFDVEPYFSPDAWQIIEGAYRIASDLKRTEISPDAIFAATLTSPFGAIFMARLGASFDAIKQPLAAHLLDASPSGNPPIVISRDARRTLVLSYARARVNRRKHVGPADLLFQSIADSPETERILDRLGFPADHVRQVAEWVGLREQQRDEYQRFMVRAALKPKTGMNRTMTAQQTPLLNRLSEDLTLAARSGFFLPIVNRTQELAAMFRAIESGNRSVVLVGETGTGKESLIEEIARRMVIEDVPRELFDRRIVAVHVSDLVASGDPSLAAERLVAMIREVEISGNIVLALTGLEALTGVGAGGTMDLVEILARELDRGAFVVIATATPAAWTQYLERRAIASRLIRVDVPSMQRDDTIRVLMARAGLIEYEQKVLLSYGAIDKAATLALRFLRDIGAPENALNVLREAAVAARKERGEHAIVCAEDAAKVVHAKTDIPVEAVTEQETEKLLNLEERMHGRVVGQDEAVVALAQALRRARAELREGKRPIANFLFLGPTGVGKTELAKTLAAEMFGDEARMVRLDMSEYQDASSIARMIGLPGDERGGLLTEAVRKRPFSVVLLDEIEKAHPEILNLFLQVMDDGRLTDGIGRTIDFTNTVVIMTSNAASSFIQQSVAAGMPQDAIKTALLERELKTQFRPEFLNRFDGVIVFRPLTTDDMVKITHLLLAGIAKRMDEKGIAFRAEDTAVMGIAHDGYDPQFGARPLRRLIQERVENQLADLILRKEVNRGDTIVMQADGKLRVEHA